MQAKACKIPILCYNGDTSELVKRNTMLWDDENLEEIINNRLWEKIDLDKAYNDAEECRADNVVPKIIKHTKAHLFKICKFVNFKYMLYVMKNCQNNVRLLISTDFW